MRLRTYLLPLAALAFALTACAPDSSPESATAPVTSSSNTSASEEPSGTCSPGPGKPGCSAEVTEVKEAADSPLSAFSGFTLTGAPLEGADFDGEPTVVWFWTSYCSICASEAGWLSTTELPAGVNLLGSPAFSSKPEMLTFVSERGVSGFPHADDPQGQLWSAFSVVSQPAWAFINSDGTYEVYSGALGPDRFNDLVAELT